MRKSLIKDDVLREICKGKTVSGGVLASRLGVSRTAVWKAVNALRAEGYFISGSVD
ncbi:MAG: HTH domain-containing protein, partial [Clostridia bacterium]|nr:HTH domain-containing protein [Clostridia bacterium]